METSVDPQMPPTNLALTVPPEMSQLVTGVDRFEVAANEYIVDTEAAFQVADETQAQLKIQAKMIDEKRKEFTRPIDAIKKKWMDFFSPAVEGRLRAATVYQSKMSRFRTEQREKALAAQRESERLLREERQRLEAEARKKEEHAAKLKTESARQKALDDAAQARATAAMVPETVALSASVPQTVASNVSELWDVDEVENTAAFLRWLADHPEWHEVLDYHKRPMMRLANQWHAIGVPGLKFIQRDSYRTKASRR